MFDIVWKGRYADYDRVLVTLPHRSEIAYIPLKLNTTRYITYLFHDIHLASTSYNNQTTSCATCGAINVVSMISIADFDFSHTPISATTHIFHDPELVVGLNGAIFL